MDQPGGLEIRLPSPFAAKYHRSSPLRSYAIRESRQQVDGITCIDRSSSRWLGFKCRWQTLLEILCQVHLVLPQPPGIGFP
ncbi:hypothetical protein SLA2020_426830 [Shorea laevis]